MKCEYETIKEVIQKYCQPSPIIFEIGAYNGYLTKPFYQYSPTKPKHYFAFEADPDNFKKMLENKNIPPEVILVNKAIAEYTGVTKFFQSSGKYRDKGSEYRGCGSIRPPKELNKTMPFIKFAELDIECVSLDDFCKGNNIDHIDLIMADIQGAEKNMILGGKEIIQKTKCIFIEKSDKELYAGQLITGELKELLSETFEIYAEWRYDIMFLNKSML